LGQENRVSGGNNRHTTIVCTAGNLCKEWLATGERFDPAVPLWITPVEGFCLPQRWVKYARRALPDYTEADEKWLAKYRD
jgi:hypothetical protein